MTTSEFRAELLRIMPGYSWRVLKSSSNAYLEATGTKSSGSNRLSTLCVVRIERPGGRPSYVSKSSGYGVRAPWLHTNTDSTLARSLRGLQDHYQQKAATYSRHAADLQTARAPKPETA